MFFKTRFFVKKAQNSVHFAQYGLVQISEACGPDMYQIMHGETRLSVSAFATVARKKVVMANFLKKLIFRSNLLCYHLMANFLQKLIFRRTIYVTITDADIRVPRYLHILFDKYLNMLNHMLLKFEQNRMVRNS